jgi:hypothetical protein
LGAGGQEEGEEDEALHEGELAYCRSDVDQSSASGASPGGASTHWRAVA